LDTKPATLIFFVMTRDRTLKQTMIKSFHHLCNSSCSCRNMVGQYTEKDVEAALLNKSRINFISSQVPTIADMKASFS
jgi:hypothetical protein